MNEKITIRYWWENSEENGKNAFFHLEDFAKETGLTLEQLNTIFEIEVSSLREWYEAIGKYLWSQRGFSDVVGISWGTFHAFLRKGKTPKFVEDWNALFAITALPCFDVSRLEQSKEEVLPKSEVVESDSDLMVAETLGDELVSEIGRVNQRDSSKAQGFLVRFRLKLKEMLENIEEDIEIVESLGGVFNKEGD